MNQVLLSFVLTTSLASLALCRVAPDGYDTIPNSPSPTSSYKFHLEDKTWEEANVICQEEGAHLIVIDSQEEANILYLLRENQEKKQYHVGMHTKGHWGDWVTVLGDSIDESVEKNWLPGEPTPDEHCGAIQLPDKHYNNIRCNFAKMPFICEKQPITHNIVRPPTNLQCLPEGYFTPNISKPSSSYKLHYEGRTWEEANLVCEEEGGYLAVVNSAAEAEFLAQLRGVEEDGHLHERRQFYVGINCKGRWGHWVSVLGDPIDKTVSENWLKGEPSPDEHCGAIQLPDKHYNNIRCNFETMPFICEKPVVETSVKSASTSAKPVLKPCKFGGYETVPYNANILSTYKIHVELKTWEEANLICQEEGAHLVVVNSLAEATILERLRRNIGIDDRQHIASYRPEFPLQYHVGLHCKGLRGNWVDVLGISANQSGFNRWLVGSPSHNAHCGAILLPAKRFNDVKCNFEKLPFICEKEPEGTLTPIAIAPKTATCEPIDYVSPHVSAVQASSYKVHYERRTWEEANLICQEEGGHLLVVETQEEADMLHRLVKSQEKTQFLIGINCKGRWGEWVNVLGDSIVESGGYNEWLKGEPTPDEHCGTIQLPDKRYNNVKCNFAMVPFICEKKNLETKAKSATPSQPPCLAPDYVSFPNVSSSYKLHKEFVSWEEANLICGEEAAHLLVVDSLEEAEHVATLGGKWDGDEFHVGMHCKGRWGDWVTILGATVEKSGFNQWLDGEPSSQEYCGAIDLSKKRLANVRCNTAPLPFICEKPAPKPALPVPALPASKCPTDSYETIFRFNATLDSSYMFHRERVTWDVANFACQMEGAHLVVIDSKVEANFVALLFGRVSVMAPPAVRGYDLVHVGITDRKREGRWKTVLGDTFTAGVNIPWRKGQPDNRGGLEHCAGMSRDKQLEDIQCNNMMDVYPFVCERKN